MIEQKFQGDIHGGQFGEIHNHPQQEPDIPENNPHLVECPQCGEYTFKYNEYCGRGICRFGVKAYFLAEEAEEREERIRLQREDHKHFCQRMGLGGFAVSCLIAFVGMNLFDKSAMAWWFFVGLLWFGFWAKVADPD
jgi:hypothetical protein